MALANGDETVDFPFDRTATADERDAALKALLGDSGYQRLQNFDRATANRRILGSLAAASLDCSIPLSSEQADQVAAILSQNSAAYQPDNKVLAPTLYWQNVLAGAQAVLTPEQSAAFDAVRQQVLFRQALGKTNR